MLEYTEKVNHQNGSADATIRKLRECLGGKRYLLVLDDVWSTNRQHWDSLSSQLVMIGGSSESVVLTTTRNDVVAEAMRASSVHHLQGLLENDSWSLFQQIAFGNRSDSDAFALETIARNVVEKCKGVPLAIKSIAGLLQSKSNSHEWKTIEESELWEEEECQATGILPSLKLSYNHLSSPLLKKGFSICAAWPKGTYFEKYEIRDRWIALGLIQKLDNKSFILEDTCEEYFNELLRISFLTVRETNEVGEATTYTLHDLVYDLARSVAKHERMYLELGNKGKKNLNIHHLTVIGHAELNLDFPVKLVLGNIRSLDILEGSPNGLLRHVKYLRVLSLESSNVEDLPKSIGNLKCLKYLDLAENPIKVLPKYVMKLHSLQSLILYRCGQLVEIHEGQLCDLVNLRHLGLSFDFCPPKGVIQQLSQLHTFPPLQLKEGGFHISELKSLEHITGKLEIKGVQVIKSKSEAKNANLSKKTRVDQLRLIWDDDGNKSLNNEEVLDGLCPHPNLKLLSIKGYGGNKFPPWLMRMNVSGVHNNDGYAGSLCNLIKFELINCGRCQQLPTLGHLSSLKKILIKNVYNLKRIGPEFYYSGAEGNENNQPSSSSSRCLMKSFASLKEVELRHLGNLVEWCEPGPAAGTAFCCLEVIIIEHCANLEIMPNEFPSLRELTVTYMKSSQPLLNIIMSNKTSLRCLKKLHIERVEEVTHIPEELGECTSLQTLFIRGCDKLSRLPKQLSNLASLEVLTIEWCTNLVSLPNLSGLVSLRQFQMLRNYGLRCVPEGMQSCKSLEQLWMDCCEKVQMLPDIAGLSRLSNLSIRGMTKMIRQPPDWLLYSLSCLRVLHIGNYEELNEFPDLSPLLNITFLQTLTVHGWEKVKSIPQQLQHFTNLNNLGIAEFENMEQFPDWLGNLPSLQELGLTRCKKLKKLPSEDTIKRLTKLRYLRIQDCPLLEEAININGPEHHKIAAAHIQVEIENSN